MSHFRTTILSALICCVCSNTSVHAAEPVAFKLVADFLKMPDGWMMEKCSAVAVNRQGEIIVLHRGKHPVLCFDDQGKLLRSWGDDLLKTGHGLRVDQEDNVWATDIGCHKVFKFDRNGKLLLSLGTGQSGAENDQFNKPTDIAFGSNGEFFISDGYVNTRVMKFSAKGSLIKSWGTAGTGAGEFDLPHSIIVDSRGRVFVGDRSNERIQIFDQEGKHLDTWPGFAPYGLAFDNDGTLYVATGSDNDVIVLDATGKIQRRLGHKGTPNIEFDIPHMLAFDASGSLFVAEVDGNRLQKLVKVVR